MFVRIPAILVSVVLFFLMVPFLRAQDPGAKQDAEAAREKLLKAADQLDNIQVNSEAEKTSVEGMKVDLAKCQGDVTKLQNDNTALRQQLAALQAAFDQFKAEQIKARQTLIDNVAGMIAAGKDSGAANPGKKKKDAPVPETPTETSVQAKPSNTHPIAPGLAPPPDPTSPSTGVSAPGGNATAPANNTAIKPQKGYYHIVASGETLILICNAYKDSGVNVTVAEIRKANGLTDKSVLKVGQKLFIPKPGT